MQTPSRPLQLEVFLRALLKFAVIAALTAPTFVFAQNTSIGIYTDAVGTTCSFGGDAPGPVTAYVIVRPDGNGSTAVQFSAPLPSCFAATYLNETVPAGLLALGSSQTGLSLAFTTCATSPVNVLQINFLQSAGTTPCCEYPIVPDPTLTAVIGTTCAFQEVELVAEVSHFNADETCNCAGNSAPETPSGPNPADHVIGVSTAPILSWFASDIDGNLSEYDLYFGTSPSPPLVAAHLTSPNYFSPLLAPNSLFYWRVVARDDEGVETSGPVWSFTTRASNLAPFAPMSPQPTNGASGLIPVLTLSWSSIDLNGDPLMYDVYFGASDPPPLVAEDVWVASYDPGLLALDTHYYWRIVVSDRVDETSGPTWEFTTRAQNEPPTIPAEPSPANGAANVTFNPQLSWTSSDPDNDPVLYDVYFGTSPSPPLAAAGISGSAFDLGGGLAFSTVYYWRIVARDDLGAESAGPIWTFTTRATNSAPNEPTSPIPADGGLVSPLLTELRWTATDSDSDPLTFAVYFGTTNPPPLVREVYSPVFVLGVAGVEVSTTYYWRVESFDGLETTSGPTWSFTTLSSARGTGDADGNGVVNIFDADCALRGFVGVSQCLGTNGAERADVNCSFSLTPRDARCIRNHVANGSCTFCGGASVPPAEMTSVPPVLYAGITYRTYFGELIVPIFISGVPSLEAFGFDVVVQTNINSFERAEPAPTQNFVIAWLGVPTIPIPIQLAGRVGGYTATNAPAQNLTLLVNLVFRATAPQQVGYVTLNHFVDDLAGAQPITFAVDPNDAPVPVFITRFEAEAKQGTVSVLWEFASDEPASTFTLLRFDESSPRGVVVAEGDAAEQSFVDSSVRPGTAYEYDLIVRTVAGDEYRSTRAKVTTPVLALALGQNHPNPFNPQTTIPFDVPGRTSSRVKLFVADATGRVVRLILDQSMVAGSHQASWDGRDNAGGSVSSGIYFAVLEVDRQRRTRKMVLLK